jgi:predicted PurR-regulated permease PerM
MVGTGSAAGGGADEGPTADEQVPAPETRRETTEVAIGVATMWRAAGVVLSTLLLVWAVGRARDVVAMLAISLFFGMALVPGVNYLQYKRGWKRGAAVAVIYLAGLLALILMTVVLIPAITRLANEIGRNGTRWLTDLNRWASDTLGIHIVSPEASTDAVVTIEEFLKQWSSKLAGAASGAVTTGVSLVVKVATIATFTFYFAADFPQLQRGLLSWFSPAHQQRLGWAMDQSITQVGGYLYSRLLLTLINGIGFFVVMVAVGMPVALAIPLAIFGAFVSEFIPSIGTYIGGAIPVALTLAIRGLVPALIVLGYVVVYQQIENFWLSPKISARTMELSGGLAFGSVVVGGALFGPMGAFVALPVAALIYSFTENYRHRYEVVYESAYGESQTAPSDESTRRTRAP